MPKLGIINQLDFQTANLIAAGEVVDRPASACKELLENAIDAGSSAVTVEIKNGGVTFMRVSDNGRGMAREDVPTALLRHATSKIREAKDLDAIATLGFRGEALAAISSVSRIRILTKRREDPVGTLLECEPGGTPVISDAGTPDGTTVIVEELFANVPARRKFLKKDQTEAMALTAALEKVALSHPEIAIRLIIDGQTKFATAGDGILKNTIYSLMGREFARRIIEVDGRDERVKVKGYIGTPDNVRANRNYQNVFINGRYVRSKCVQAALEQAFTSYCPSEKFPTCVLNITLPPAAVDVNVHPAKLEVKFADEKGVFEAVYYAVRGSLEKNITRPQLNLGRIDPTGKTMSDITYEMMQTINAFKPIEDRADRQPQNKPVYNNQKNIKQGQLSYADLIRDLPPEPKPAKPSEPTPADNPEPDEPKWPEKPNYMVGEPYVHPKPKVPLLRSYADIPESSDLDTIPPELEAMFPPVKPKYRPPEPEVWELPPEIAAIPTGEELLARKKAREEARRTAHLQEPSHVSQKSSMDEEVVPPASVPAASPAPHPVPENPPKPPVSDPPSIADRKPPEYKIIGEAFYSYVFVEVGDKVLIIDKHAAHERIIFESLKTKYQSRAGASQLLLVPMEISMTPSEVAAIRDFSDDIRLLGFEFTVKDDHTLHITAVPPEVSAGAVPDMLVELADRVGSGTASAAIDRALRFEKALYQASCKAAIKIGRIENIVHIKWICDRLLMLDDIKFCPHGRPVAFEISKSSIERQFGRE